VLQCCHQSCQQATFSGLIWPAAWPSLIRAAWPARLRIKDQPAAWSRLTQSRLTWPGLAWSAYEAEAWSKSFDPSLSKSMISMRKLYVIVDQNMSFCRGRLELSSEKDSSIPINLLKCYDYFTNLNLKFLRYIFLRQIKTISFQ
jgi:hypothetical protein